jgi:hypothetical protein
VERFMPEGRCSTMKQEPNAVWEVSQMGKFRTTDGGQ